MDKYIGRLLDNRYEILEVIGTGGMAVVYKARCHRLNRLVAIKILKDDFMEDEDFRRRFHSESQAVAMLSHPNIVSVYDVSTSIMADYIVMELIEGISLKQYMEKKGVLNWKETLHFAIQIAKALEHAHSRGIVHRDIKPHNVMVLKNGSVKVTDFGIARMMSQGNTLTKEALGSVHYISPEQAKGGRVDNRSDIYSLGVVMYEMMSGRPPYDGDSPVAVAIQHINGGALLPSALNPNIPGGLEQIIMKAMEQDQNKRYSSASEMLRDMDEFRKDPAILFDYNTPKEDVIKIHKPSQPTETVQTETAAATVKTTAERVVEKKEGTDYKIQNGDGYTGGRRGGSRSDSKKKEPGKRNNTAIIAIIACCMVALIAIVIIMVVLINPGSGGDAEQIKVPDLVGKIYEDLSLSDYPDFSIKLQTTQDTGNYEDGQIVNQEPKAGTEVDPNTTIWVVVFQDPALQTQPSETETTTAEDGPIRLEDLTHLSEDDARSKLMAYDLDLEVHTEKSFSEEYSKGTVMKMDPAVDTELTKGQKVTLTISYGEQPELKDYTGAAATDVETELTGLELGLKIEKEYEFNDDVEADSVITTKPVSGTPIKFDMTVTLVISKGSEAVKEELPTVVGLSVADATRLLRQKGFYNYETEDVYSDVPHGQVIGLYVAEDLSADLTKPVDVANTIVLKVSIGQEETQADPVEKSPVVTMPTEDRLKDLGWLDTVGTTFTVYIVQDENIIKMISGVSAGSEVTVSLTGTGYQEFLVCIGSIENVYDTLRVDFDAEDE